MQGEKSLPWGEKSTGEKVTQPKVDTFTAPTTPIVVEGVVVPEGGRERTQGYQLRLETAPVLLYRFLIIGVEL